MRLIVAVMAVMLGACSAPAAVPAAAENADPEAGRLYAMRLCSNCHNVIGRTADAVPWRLGPSFFAVANEKTTSALGLSVFLQTPHANMPNLIIPEQDRRNVIAHILTLAKTHRGDGT